MAFGANYLFLKEGYHYVEVFGGIENIFKIFRVDYVRSFQTGGTQQSGIRIGLPLLFNDTGVAH